MTIVTSDPLATTYSGFPDALKAILARLAVSDLFLTNGATVSLAEESAMLKDLIAICGEVIAFKAISTHVNDVYTNNGTTAQYGGSYNNDPLTVDAMTGGQTMSPGQETALCMFIRANQSLSSMLKIIGYGQLISFLKALVASGVSVTTEAALGKVIKTARATQYDISTQLTFIEGNSTRPAAVSAKNATVFDTTTANDLIYALTKDAIFTNSGDDFPQLTATLASNTHLPKLWLITKLTSATHPIRSIGSLTSNYYGWTISSASSGAVAGDNVVTYTGTKISKDPSTSNAIFTSAHVLQYVVLVSSGATVTYYPVAASSYYYYHNNATAYVAGTLNADALITTASINEFVSQRGASVLFNGFLLSQANLRTLGLSLSTIIAALNTTSPIVTPLTAANAGYSNAEITAAFSFSELASNGTYFSYISFAAAPDNNGSNRALVDKFVSLYTSTNAAFYNNVNTRYSNLTGILGSVPSTATEIRRAVISYLLSTMQYPTTTSPVATKPSTTSTETVAFVGTLLPSNGSVSYKNVYTIDEVAAYSTTTKAPAKFSFSDLVNTFGYTPKDVTSMATNKWPSNIVLTYWGPNTIFSAANTTYKADGSVDRYPVSIVEALLNNGTNPVISGAYDGIPYSTIVNLLSDSEVVAAVVADLSKSAGLLAGATVSSTTLPKIFDALNLTLAQARSYIGKTVGNSTGGTFPIALSHIASMKNLSPVQRRSMFAGIADAANQYAVAGLTTAEFLNLRYPAKDWSNYISAGNLSVNVTMYDLLSLTETVQTIDSDFFVSTVASTRAVYNKLDDRKQIVKAFIPTANEALQLEYATAAFQDLPRPIDLRPL